MSTNPQSPQGSPSEARGSQSPSHPVAEGRQSPGPRTLIPEGILRAADAIVAYPEAYRGFALEIATWLRGQWPSIPAPVPAGLEEFEEAVRAEVDAGYMHSVTSPEYLAAKSRLDAARASLAAPGAPQTLEHSEDPLGMAKLLSDLEAMARETDPAGYMVSARYVLDRLKTCHDRSLMATESRNPLHEAPGTPIEKAAREGLHQIMRDAATITQRLTGDVIVLADRIHDIARASLSSLPQEQTERPKKARECTCVDHCRGGSGLAQGWFCKMAGTRFDPEAPKLAAQEGAAGEGEPLPSVGEPKTALNAPTWAPKRIYLQPADEDMDEEVQRPTNQFDMDGASWCEDRVNDFDVEYVRADLVPKAAKPPLSPKGEGSNTSNTNATQEGAQEPKEGDRK